MEKMLIMTRNLNILDRQSFDSWLLNWYQNTNEKTVGDIGNFGQQAFLWVEDNSTKFRLNADTKREGVKVYLDLLKENNNALNWSIVANLKGKINKVAFVENKIVNQRRIFTSK
jgi:hypothetical protein